MCIQKLLHVTTLINRFEEIIVYENQVYLCIIQTMLNLISYHYFPRSMQFDIWRCVHKHSPRQLQINFQTPKRMNIFSMHYPPPTTQTTTTISKQYEYFKQLSNGTINEKERSTASEKRGIINGKNHLFLIFYGIYLRDAF